MKIAVVVPHRNAGKWLKRCLDSLDARFMVFPIDDDALQVGVAGARNKGLQEALDAGADYITFLDADDTFAPDAYGQMEAAIKEAGGEPLVQLNHLRVMPTGDKWPRMPNDRGIYELDHLPQLWMSVCNKVIRADLVKDIRFPVGLRHGEDEIFVLSCLQKARRIYNSQRVALHYHKDNPKSLSSSTTSEDLFGEQVALLEMLYDYLEDKELCEAIRGRQAELWKNATYKRVFGGSKK